MPISNRIKELRLQRNLSLQDLADLAGTTKSQISRLENADRRLTDQWMIRLARALECAPVDLMAADERFPRATLDPLAYPFDLPLRIMRALQLPPEHQVLEGYHLSEDGVEFRRRPPGVANAADAYCAYVPTDALIKYDRGDLVVVRPDRIAKIGDAVLLSVRGTAADALVTYIGRLIRADRQWTTIEVDRPSTARDQFATATVVHCHKILSTEELLGF